MWIVKPNILLFYAIRNNTMDLIVFLNNQGYVFTGLTLKEKDRLAQGSFKPRGLSSRLFVFLKSHSFIEFIGERGAMMDVNNDMSRQIAFYSNFGTTTEALAFQEKLSNLRVLIIGVGGIGCHLI